MTTIELLTSFLNPRVCQKLFQTEIPIFVDEAIGCKRYNLKNKEIYIDIIIHEEDEAMLLVMRLLEIPLVDPYSLLQHISTDLHIYDKSKHEFYSSSVGYTNNMRILVNLSIFLTRLYLANKQLEKIKMSLDTILISDAAAYVVEKAYPCSLDYALISN